MAGIADIFNQIGRAFVKKKDFSPQKQAPAGQPGMPIPPKGFDFNIYMQAVKIFGKDFFGKKVPDFFKDPMMHFHNFPDWWAKQKQDEQIAYGGVLTGFMMIIVGVVLIIVI